jgi:hypothetical protein
MAARLDQGCDRAGAQLIDLFAHHVTENAISTASYKWFCSSKKTTNYNGAFAEAWNQIHAMRKRDQKSSYVDVQLQSHEF